MRLARWLCGSSRAAAAATSTVGHETEQRSALLATSMQLAMRYPGECAPGVANAVGKLREGGGVEIFGPELADAFRACGCRAVDLDGPVASLSAVGSPGVVTRGWIPLWARDDMRWATLGPRATIDDLARLLVGIEPAPGAKAGGDRGDRK